MTRRTFLSALAGAAAAVVAWRPTLPRLSRGLPPAEPMLNVRLYGAQGQIRGEYPTIREAMWHSGDGDMIYVPPGYRETFS